MVLKEINQSLGESPLLETEQRLLSGETEESSSTPAPTSTVTTTTLVTSDGTYATQSAFNTVQ